MQKRKLLNYFITKNKLMPRGGKRTGSGRPKLFGGKPTIRITKTVPVELEESLSKAFDKEINNQFKNHDWT
jgi:hypothetical protein